MEENPQNQNLANTVDDQNKTLNPNNAYSGSGDMQSENDNLKAESLDENLRKVDTILGNQTDELTRDNPDKGEMPPGGRTFEEMKNPEKLSDL
jgi:hypothetical protein